jgi:hypothetical protein
VSTDVRGSSQRASNDIKAVPGLSLHIEAAASRQILRLDQAVELSTREETRRW